LSDVLEAEVVEDAEVAALVPTTGSTLAVTPDVGAEELVKRLDVIRQAATTAMTKDVDFGVIPGTDKPTLYKPGAEKLSVLFQLDVQITNEKVWGPDDHLTVMSKATAYHAPSGTRLGFGEGLCSTREKRYAVRKAERVCPECQTPAIIKGKEEYGGGWVCFRKKDGCGAKFPDNDQRITGQTVGNVENPDLPDLWNTVVKMAEKRARVDVVLAVTGASALFTQDVEDRVQGEVPPPETPPVEPTPPQRLQALIVQHEIAADAVELIRGWVSVKGALDPNRVNEAIALLEAGNASDLLKKASA
jgi:hypothetical protein